MKIGKVSESVLNRSVLKNIRNKRNEVLCGAGVGADCAIFTFSDAQFAISTVQEGRLKGYAARKEQELSCSCESGKTPAVSIAHLMEKAANNLAAAGGEPVAMQLVLLLPDSIEEPEIKAIMAEAESTAVKLSVQIAGGQTRVTEAVNEPMAVVTAYGSLHSVPLRGAKPGQDIVLSKWIGLEGTAALAAANRTGLLTRYPEYLVDEAQAFSQYYSVIPEAATAVKSGVCAMHDASEGGIFTALWELAEAAGVGLTVDIKKLPLKQETVEVCEFCNVNPYELLSGGCLVMTTEDGPGLIAALEAEHIPACMVGKITDSKDRIILNGDEVRYMDRPRTDEIYK